MNPLMNLMIPCIVLFSIAPAFSQETPESLFKTIFGSDIAKLQNTQNIKEAAGLSQKILMATKEFASKPDFQTYFAFKGVEYAMKGRNYLTAIELLQLLEDNPTTDPGRLYENLLDAYEHQYRISTGAAREESGSQVLNLCLKLGDWNRTEGNPTRAEKYYRKALAMSGVLKENRNQEIRGKLAIAVDDEKIQKEIQRLQEAQAKTPPLKPEEAKRLLALCLAEKNDLKLAVQLLDTAQPETTTRENILLALSDKLTPEQSLRLGNWYRQLSTTATTGGKYRMYKQAQKHYKAYLDSGPADPVKLATARVYLDDIQTNLNKMNIVSPSTKEWRIIFSSDDPAIWNTRALGPNFALPLDHVDKNIKYIRLRRMDTKDYVLFKLPVAENVALNTVIKTDPFVWNGTARIQTRFPDRKRACTNRLLGIASTADPVDYKKGAYVLDRTGRTGYGGWGFAKMALFYSNQAYMWNRKEIAKTTFEIAVKTNDNLTPQEKNSVLNK